ncbi:MFS transporter [Paenibacillus nasutitermitis]|uniref:Fosmidomycin resistance protein n=1 Tax=Paenibacillus nasutitermitis TaxID=1652958 RepID=A0A916ZF84_9BACL|nr:MFS transporter [Paenibacillus nasutitermitis]GGD93654.1 fosmidomycin resistance protein [Paenibacillus nasutitermitis]
MSQASIQTAAPAPKPNTRSAFYILLGVSLAHLLNDAMQSVVSAVFPLFQQSMHLSFAQIGWVAFTLSITASILQPLIGYYTDKKPIPALLPAGMVFTLLGMVGLAFSTELWMLLTSATLIGIGSSVLHPESSRVAHMAAGQGKGLAQSVFQVGGNTGQALAPLMVAFVITPLGQPGFLWFTGLAASGILVQLAISRWYSRQTRAIKAAPPKALDANSPQLARGAVVFAISILILLLFSKFVYIASMTGYYAFYFMDQYQLPLERAQICLFALQFAGMIGTLFGGPLADRFGRQRMIWFSIVGTAPFSMLLPYADAFWSVVLCLFIGVILMSGFSVIIVYAQELLPGKVGTVSGLFFGLAFGLGGIGSIVLGWLMDVTSVSLVIHLCAYLPLLGICAFFLPKDRRARQVT